MQRRNVSSETRSLYFRQFAKWILNAILVITIFTLGSDKLLHIMERTLTPGSTASAGAWFLVFLLSAPSIWAMLSSFPPNLNSPPSTGRRAVPRGLGLLISRILTVGLLGLLSMRFFPAVVTLVSTLGLCTILFFVFRKQLEAYYRWMEIEFSSGFQGDQSPQAQTALHLDRLAPWDAHLVEVKVPPRSVIAGHTLLELKLRERYGLNIVVILREGESIVAPTPLEFLYPGDRILCFATDADIERFRDDIDTPRSGDLTPKELDDYDIRRFSIKENCPLRGVSIRASGIREAYTCIVVGLERRGERMISPSSDCLLELDDVLWVVGDRQHLQKLTRVFD